MTNQRFRSVVDEVCLALGEKAGPAEIEMVAADVLSALGWSAPADVGVRIPSRIAAIVLELPLAEPPAGIPGRGGLSSPDRATVSAYAWERITTIAGPIARLCERRFPGVPLRLRTTSLADLAAGLRTDDLLDLAVEIDHAAGDVHVERVYLTWARLPRASRSDRAVLDQVGAILDRTSRLFGRVDVTDAHNPVSGADLAAFGETLSHAVRAGVLNAADRLLAGCRGTIRNSGIRLEAIVVPTPVGDSAAIADDVRRGVTEVARRASDWTGLAISAGPVARCAECPAPGKPSGTTFEGARFAGWPVPDDAPGEWTSLPQARLADGLNRLSSLGLDGVYRVSDPPAPGAVPQTRS